MTAAAASSPLAGLQSDTARIRNICILAHVDHGKTTLSDSLIASNGIISQRLAGQLRYLDSREDEQQRGITMESSAISLLFRDPREQRRLDRAAAKQAAAAAAAAAATAAAGSGPAAGSAAEKTAAAPVAAPYLINLIDSPGHVDFSSDVSTAVRLCDGALVVVDAVEGVCIQTQAVLRQAWEERVKPCLVINKLDRLILEIHLTPLEAFHHVRQIIERVNALVSQLATADALAKDEGGSARGVGDGSGAKEDKRGRQGAGLTDAARAADSKRNGDDDADHDKSLLPASEEADFLFDPRRGNVVFGSAIHGWAFSLGPFATLLSKRLQIGRTVLLQHLWGDFFYNPKAKTVTRKPKGANHLPMIAKYILEPIWQVYTAACVNNKPKKCVRMAQSLGVALEMPPDRILRNSDKLVREVMKAWLPLPQAVLACTVTHVPNPRDAQQKRAQRLFPAPSGARAKAGAAAAASSSSGSSEATNIERQTLSSMQAMHDAVRACTGSADSPLVAFVSKMIAVQRRDLPVGVTVAEVGGGDNGGDGTTAAARDDDMIFVAFARVFSGTLRRGQAMHVLGPKYHPSAPRMRPVVQAYLDEQAAGGDGSAALAQAVREVHHCSQVGPGVVHPMMMMGSNFEPLEEAGPGNIVAIAGLGPYILKSATLCETPLCCPFAEMATQATPILSVAIEPKSAVDMRRLRRGLALLNHADPCVEVSLSAQGEMVVRALGELHLERCLDDLRLRFAKGLEFDVSPPLVMFRESLAGGGGDADGSAGSGRAPVQQRVEVKTPNGVVTMTVEATALPESATRLLERHAETLRSLRTFVAEEEDGTAIQEDDDDTGQEEKGDDDSSDVNDGRDGDEGLAVAVGAAELASLREGLRAALGQADYDRICAVGPHHSGPNVLLADLSWWRDWRAPWLGAAEAVAVAEGANRETPDGASQGGECDPRVAAQRTSIINGFQLAVEHGPLCEEPMWGVCFRITRVGWRETTTVATNSTAAIGARDAGDAAAAATDLVAGEVSIMEEDENGNDAAETNDTAVSVPVERDPYGPLSGQVISSMRRGCRAAYKARTGANRLVEATFLCDVQCTGDQLGGLYAVLGQRRSEILEEDMWEGTSIFAIQARIPVAATVGMADHLRKETSGGISSPQLVFDRWQLLDMDPFFKPTTVQEREEFGELRHDGQLKNLAKEYIDKTRARKGLSSGKKIVVAAEKQRTLQRKK